MIHPGRKKEGLLAVRVTTRRRPRFRLRGRSRISSRAAHEESPRDNAPAGRIMHLGMSDAEGRDYPLLLLVLPGVARVSPEGGFTGLLVKQRDEI